MRFLGKTINEYIQKRICKKSSNIFEPFIIFNLLNQFKKNELKQLLGLLSLSEAIGKFTYVD